MVLSETVVTTGSTMDEGPKETLVRTDFLTARVPQSLIERVDRLAEKTDRNRSQIIRLAVKAFLERNEDIVA